MQPTPKSMRLHIGIFGRRNSGKSSLLNAITKQQVSIVSDVAGTTTDPVEKPMEFLPLGPVLFIDTAGIDDTGTLGAMRIGKTRQIYDRVDIGVILAVADSWGEFEEEILAELMQRQVPIIVVFNKIDICKVSAELSQKFCNVDYKPGIKSVAISAKENLGLIEFREVLLKMAPEGFINNPVILRDLVAKGEYAILVTPIDKEAPKGRLILPEVQAIRDLLDGDAYCVVTQQTQLPKILHSFNVKPKLVVTDSQCFKEVAECVPGDIALTSFSILFSRFRGDIVSQAADVTAINRLKPGDKVLICEACSHHPISEDIGREKIPKLLQKYVNGSLDITIRSGHDFPSNLTDYKIIIQCGSCMLNRREVLSRILHCRNLGVPFTNYGLVIAHCLGILQRTLQPFPAALDAYEKVLKLTE